MRDGGEGKRGLDLNRDLLSGGSANSLLCTNMNSQTVIHRS